MARSARAADSRSGAPSGSAPTTGDFDSGTLLAMLLPPLFGLGGLQLCEEALDLQNMIGVMPGEHACQVGNRFPAALEETLPGERGQRAIDGRAVVVAEGRIECHPCSGLGVAKAVEDAPTQPARRGLERRRFRPSST